jgi:hypothetical protein
MPNSTSSRESERQYVRAERNSVYEALIGDSKEPSLVLKVLGTGVLTLIVAGLILPLHQPIRQPLGPYLYAHIAVIVVVLYLFFFRLLPPPKRATKRMRHRFMNRLQEEKLRAAGLNSSFVLGAALADDPDTLEITVSKEWLNQSYERRLGDCQKLWWLWALTYQPYEGWDKALITLVDHEGIELGGSKPGAGSLLWVTKS